MKKMIRAMENQFHRNLKTGGQHTLDPRRHLEAADSLLVNEDYHAMANLSMEPIHREIPHNKSWGNIFPVED